MSKFKTWLSQQELQTGIVIIPTNKELTVKIPDEEQVLREHTCPVGCDELAVFGKEESITLKNGDEMTEETAVGYNDEENNIMMSLVEQGIIRPRYERDGKNVLWRRNSNGELETV